MAVPTQTAHSWGHIRSCTEFTNNSLEPAVFHKRYTVALQWFTSEWAKHGTNFGDEHPKQQSYVHLFRCSSVFTQDFFGKVSNHCHPMECASKDCSHCNFGVGSAGAQGSGRCQTSAAGILGMGQNDTLENMMDGLKLEKSN